MDNVTMVESFKYLNYCQLAMSSLVSMRFRNVIQTHRHNLALLYVRSIEIEPITDDPHAINVFDKDLSSQEYNDWVILNQYSKQVPVEDQIACTESTQNIPNGYLLNASAYYKAPNHRECYDTTSVFSAYVEFSNENWPLFQHFVRLATDPFIYIEYMRLTYQNAVLNSLSGAVNPNRRLQCKELGFNLEGNSQKSITWIKNHMRCSQLYIHGKGDLNQDEALLDFFVNGGHCTSKIDVSLSECLSKVVVDFVQKFMDLKHSDESQFVKAIEGNFDVKAVELLKRNYAKFVAKDERHEQIFEFGNNDIGEKFQLTAENYANRAILAPHNLTVDEYNKNVLDMLPGKARIYDSTDTQDAENGEPMPDVLHTAAQ